MQDLGSFMLSMGAVKPKKEEDSLAKFMLGQGAIQHPSTIPEEHLIEPKFESGLFERLGGLPPPEPEVPMPGLRAAYPEEKERLEVPEWALGQKIPKEIAGWSKDPKVNYISQKLAERAPLWLTGFAGIPAIIAIFEGLQQARNIVVSLKEKTKYDPIAHRRIEEILSPDTPPWLRTTVEIGEPIFDMVVAAVVAKKLSPKVFTKNLEAFYKKAIKAGHPAGKLKRVIEKLVSSKVLRPETLDDE